MMADKYGTNGDDVLVGTGNDRLFGLGGNDTYYVDDAQVEVRENANEGVDTVHASVSYILTPGQHIENLFAVNPLNICSIDLAGNEFAQTIVGSDGNNVLEGGGG